MTKKEEKKIIVILSIFCLAAFFVFHLNRWLLGLALFLTLTEIIGGKIPYLIAKGWRKFAVMLGEFNSRVILFLAFYLFLTPLAVLFRLFNKKAVAHFKNDNRNSFFVDVNKPCDKEVFRKMW